jgi:mRNA interferase RelE/StbE
VSLRVEYDEGAIGQAAAFLDDLQGIRQVLDAIDRLADDPRPAGSYPYGSPDLRRLRVGRYQVLYEITEDAAPFPRRHAGHRPRPRNLFQDAERSPSWRYDVDTATAAGGARVNGGWW